MSLFADIEKSFPDFKLSAKIEADSEVIALLGGSGCGKSLTLKCIAGIEKPDKGRIVISGETVFDSERHINITPQKRGVGYLFQNYALFPNMTVRKNIECVINKPKDEKKQITDDIIKAFQLESVKELYPRQISGGQQQRAALARILVSNPKILMLDEPFSALDSHLKWSMERELSGVLEDFRGTTVFVSHDSGEAYRISGKIAVMSAGKIELIGNKEDIFNSPKTLAAAKITGCKNISGAKKAGERLVEALDWGVTLKTAQPVPDEIRYVGIRANSFELGNDTRDEGRDIFVCRVRRVIDEPYGKLVSFTFSGGDTIDERLYWETMKDITIREGEVAVTIPPEKVICLE